MRPSTVLTINGTSPIGSCNRKLRDKEAFNRIGDEEVKSKFVPKIVEEKLWRDVNNKRDKRAVEKQNVKPQQSGLMSGVLYCGHCNYALDKVQRSDTQKSPYVYYTCKSGTRYTGKLECSQWRILEKDILPLVLENVLLGVKSEIKKLKLLKNSMPSRDGIDNLIARQESIQRKIDRANDRFLEAEDLTDQMKPALLRKLKNLSEQKKAVESLILSSRIQFENASLPNQKKSLVDCLTTAFTTNDEIVFQPSKRRIIVKLDEDRSGDKEFDLVLCPKNEIRSFLKNLGCKVFVKWQRKRLTDKQGNPKLDPQGVALISTRYFEVKDVQVTCSVPAGQVLAVPSNSCIRANSRDTD